MIPQRQTLTISNFHKIIDKAPSSIEKYFLLFDNKDISAPVEIMELFPASQTFKTEQIMMLTVTAGNIEIMINQDEVIIEEGDFLYITPDSTIQVHSTTPGFSYQLYIIYPQLVKEVLTKININYTTNQLNHRYELTKCTDEALRYRTELYEEIKKELSVEGLQIKKQLSQLYATIVIINNISYFNIETSIPNKVVSRHDNTFQKFLELLNIHSGKERRVQFYAQQLGVTPKYLSCITLEYSNKNASKWIDDYVTEKAKALLREHKYTIKEVSEILGFTSLSFFGRFFKRNAGVAPKVFLAEKTKK